MAGFQKSRRLGLESFKDGDDQQDLSEFDAHDARMGLTLRVGQINDIDPSVIGLQDKRLGELEDLPSVSKASRCVIIAENKK